MSRPTDSCWQFWIDVGGTFTDCVAISPSGAQFVAKVLSSGVVKGMVGDGSTASVLSIPELAAAAPRKDDFWVGYRLRLLDALGRVAIETEVVGSDSSTRRLRVAPELPHPPRPGQAFELASPEDAPLLAIRTFLGLRLDEPVPPCSVRLGTTRGTNALLTRRGAKVGFVTTRGFADVLRIGYQQRPRLFDLVIRKPTPLYVAVAEIEERVTADGGVLVELDDDQARFELERLQRQGVESLAICLMNAYAQPAHERRIEQLARELGFAEISASHAVSPLMKMVPRGDTTLVDAYLNPVLRQYVARLQRALPGSDLRLMTSAGGLLSPEAFTGKDSILSGPAGGVVGFSRAARAAGCERSIGFDMGGTSTDVSRFDGRLEHEFETEKAGVRIAAPMLAIETVAAGGGSICAFDGVKLTVGPESAGADPGPACYGKGGPLTVTDCNLYLGRIVPACFAFPLQVEATEQRLKQLAAEIQSATGRSTELIVLAEGFVKIANANMAAAIREISIAKGYDARQYALAPFGSAGPQHACAVASELGIRRVVIDKLAGVLSARGIGAADVVRHRVEGVYRPYDAATLAEVEAIFARLEAAARDDVVAEGIEERKIEVRRSLDLRYRGVDATLPVAAGPTGDYRETFTQEHQRRYGYIHPQKSLEVVAARVEAIGRSEPELLPRRKPKPVLAASPKSTALFFDGQWHEAQVFFENEMQWPLRIVGPAVVVEALTTIVVPPQWELVGDEHGYELTYLSAEVAAVGGPAMTAELADPAQLEVFNNRFTAIATQMGVTLQNTASSVNVKERLDFSCALFTADGDLVVNAPHIPVHLGAMSETVKRMIADNPRIRPGDAFVTNDPYRGGSHLPDVTVVTPVFADAVGQGDGQRQLAPQPIFFTASRAHHAEIGGITPGSMPPFSRSLAEEGVLIRNFKLLEAGQSRAEELRRLLSSGLFPSRAVADNLADISAQLAANQQGANDLRQLIEQQTLPVVLAYMRHIQAAAETKVRAALARLPPGRRSFVDRLDDGTPIQAAIDIHGETATIDFTGTGPVQPGNLNANRAIVTAAVLYCLRLLIGEDVPLNQGVLAPITLVLPECLLNPPERERAENCAAVVGGNVETSQRVVDVLLGAFGLAAASQGTMNNVLFGDATFGYYETICGGSGATAAADGADAVHTHMTNTRLTDPEVLEKRFPVRLREFAIRKRSGGRGQYVGGDGVRRRIEFLRPLKLSLLTQRRGPFAPYGVNGGEPGALGRNWMERAAGGEEELPAQVQVDVEAGDILTIETPGGGGWGAVNAVH